MEIKELVELTQYKEKHYLPIIRIETSIICPKCKKHPAQIIFLTAHSTILNKIICKKCGITTNRTKFNPENGLYQKRKWIINYLKKYAFINLINVKTIAKVLERNLIGE